MKIFKIKILTLNFNESSCKEWSRESQSSFRHRTPESTARAWNKLARFVRKENLWISVDGGGLPTVVNMIAFYSDDPCSNPVEVYSFFLKNVAVKVWK